jgi:hypothetical protein
VTALLPSPSFGPELQAAKTAQATPMIATFNRYIRRSSVAIRCNGPDRN